MAGKSKTQKRKNSKTSNLRSKGTLTPAPKKAAGLYGSPNSYQNFGKFHIRPYTYAQDTEKSITQYNRLELVNLSRQLFANMAFLSAASEQIANYSIGPCFDPIYSGEDSTWGKQAVEWLTNSWYPQANIKGFAFDFKTTLKLISKTLDKDGDVLMLLIQTRQGLAKLQFVATHRIVQRNNGSSTVQGGRYDGLDIQDGVVSNAVGTPVAYLIQGETQDDDYYAPVSSAYLIYSADFLDKPRGIPAVSPAILTGLSIQDIDEDLQAAIKLESLFYLLKKNQSGEAPEQTVATAQFNEDENFGAVTPPCPPSIEPLQGGIQYLKTDEDVKSFQTTRPAVETQEFIRRLEIHLLSSLGWPHQILYSPEKVGGAAARGISDIARRTIETRQLMLEKYARIAIAFAVSVAIQNGFLPATNDEYWKYFSFTRPAVFTLDSGYERDNDRKDYILGAKTLDEITTARGKRLTEVRTQRKQEVLDLYADIAEIKKAFPDYSPIQIHNDMQMLSANPLQEPPENKSNGDEDDSATGAIVKK